MIKSYVSHFVLVTSLSAGQEVNKASAISNQCGWKTTNFKRGQFLYCTVTYSLLKWGLQYIRIPKETRANIGGRLICMEILNINIYFSHKINLIAIPQQHSLVGCMHWTASTCMNSIYTHFYKDHDLYEKSVKLPFFAKDHRTSDSNTVIEIWQKKSWSLAYVTRETTIQKSTRKYYTLFYTFKIFKKTLSNAHPTAPMWSI